MITYISRSPSSAFFLKSQLLLFILVVPLFPFQSSAVQLKGHADASRGFVENQGQWADWIKYQIDTFSGTVALNEEGEIDYLLSLKEGGKEAIRFQEEFVEASFGSIVPEIKTGTKVSYYQSKDRKRWRQGLDSYKAIAVQDLYQGINLKLIANNNNIEKIFDIQPGGDVSDIKITPKNIDSLTTNASGELLLQQRSKLLSFTKPVAWQWKEGRKQFVEVSYNVIRSIKQYGFSVEKYDTTLPLHIDPLLSGTFLGTVSIEYPLDLTTLSNGDVLVTGYFRRSDFPIEPEGVNVNNIGIFLSRFSADLSQLYYSAYLGTSFNDRGGSAVIETVDNDICVVGTATDQSNLTDDQSAQRYIKGTGSKMDLLIVCLDESLTDLRATHLGGSARDEGWALASAPDGGIYVAGYTESSDFPVTSISTPGGAKDGFISHLNRNLSTLEHSIYYGGSDDDMLHAVQTRNDGGLTKVYIAGTTSSAGLAKAGYDMTLDNTDIIVARFSSDLTTLEKGTYIGGGGIEAMGAVDGVSHRGGSGMVLNAEGHVYVTGGIRCSTAVPFPVIGGYDSICPDNTWEALAIKLSADLDALEASTYLGGAGEDFGLSIKVDPSDAVYISGYTEHPGTDTSLRGLFDGYDEEVVNGRKGFIAKLKSDLSAPLQAFSYLGGSPLIIPAAANYDFARSVSIDHLGEVYVTGSTETSIGVVEMDLSDRLSSGSYQPNPIGSDDIFVVHLDAWLSRLSLGFSEEASQVDEEAGTASVPAERLGDSTGTVSVVCASTTGGTAVEGEDYLTVDQILNWGDGVTTSQDCMVTLQGNFRDEGERTVELVLSNWSGGAAPGAIINHTLTIIDDDSTGIDTTPGDITTRETDGLTGYKAEIDVRLKSEPYGAASGVSTVIIDVTSNDKSEGIVSPPQLTFTSDNWNTNQKVYVAGQDDPVDDDNIEYTITLNPSSTNDSRYNSLVAETVTALNIDDDIAAISAFPDSDLKTSEPGGQATVTVKLDTKPVSDVAVSLSSSLVDGRYEGTPSPTTLLFTPDNWNFGQEITVTGEDDFIDDGEKDYKVNLSASSSDLKYDGLIAQVSLGNIDDDTADVSIVPGAMLQTSESDTDDQTEGVQISVSLASEPISPVTVEFTPSDVSEGIPNQLLIQPANWSDSHVIRVIGKDDGLIDGSQMYDIMTSVSSIDAKYNVVDPDDVVGVTNLDNETAFPCYSPGYLELVDSDLPLGVEKTCTGEIAIGVLAGTEITGDANITLIAPEYVFSELFRVQQGSTLVLQSVTP